MGVDFCKQLIEDLAEYNPLIVSGFARGIDIVAHKAALDNGLETVACLGHGLNQIYPTEHKTHVESVCNQGAILTEFWSNSSFEKSNFSKRNRIIAGVAHATLVIVSKAKGAVWLLQNTRIITEGMFLRFQEGLAICRALAV